MNTNITQEPTNIGPLPRNVKVNEGAVGYVSFGLIFVIVALLIRCRQTWRA